VLSELPEEWRAATSRWARINRRGRTLIDGQSCPSRNEEYLLYQTLVGTWPLDGMGRLKAAPTTEVAPTYRDRIVAYMQKAMREAKICTSWLNPSEAHEQAMTRFVDFVLARDHSVFRADFMAFVHRVSTHGIYNSLAQLAVKIGAPGVPDVYQGSELWDFTLVDPDNRRPVDYAYRQALLAELETAVAAEGEGAVAARLAASPFDDRLKLLTTMTLLRLRREEHTVFDCGAYQPLTVTGTHRERVFAFARSLGTRHVVVAVPRLTASFDGNWDDTTIELPRAAFHEVFTGQCFPDPCLPDPSRPAVRAAELFDRFPIAALRGH
jgi:(1->4)-alpha-D-glucan 1-alpha-D-glucosylmutase